MTHFHVISLLRPLSPIFFRVIVVVVVSCFIFCILNEWNIPLASSDLYYHRCPTIKHRHNNELRRPFVIRTIDKFLRTEFIKSKNCVLSPIDTNVMTKLIDKSVDLGKIMTLSGMLSIDWWWPISVRFGFFRRCRFQTIAITYQLSPRPRVFDISSLWSPSGRYTWHLCRRFVCKINTAIIRLSEHNLFVTARFIRRFNEK